MAVGSRVIDVINRDKLLTNAAMQGEILKKGLNEMVGKNGVIDVRGIGLMIGIEFDSKMRRDERLIELFENGLLLLPAGQKVMRVIPPLTIKEEEIHEGIEIMNEVLMRS